MVNMTLGGRLREAREKAGLSRNKLAVKIGVTPHTVWNWERDANEPSFSMVVRFARATGASLDWLAEVVD